jgi:hypothetical protein
VRKVVHEAVARWKQQVQMNRALHEASDDWLELYDQHRLQKAFSVWVDEVRARIMARHHYEGMLQARYDDTCILYKCIWYMITHELSFL